MKSKFAILVIGLMIIVCTGCSHSDASDIQQDNWNGGYCEDDGSRLNFIQTDNMYRYQCPVCGKQYSFKSIQKYERR